MLRKSVFLLSLLCLAAWCAVNIGCGGSSSPKKTACTGSYNIVGDWQGTATGTGSSDSLTGIINSTGEAMFFDSQADIVSLPQLTGTCSFSETLTAYESTANGGASSTGTATGNVNSDTSITGSDVSNGTTTNFTFSSYAPISTITAVTGTVGAVIEGQLSDSLILSLGGTSSAITFSGTDATNCTINGTATEEGTNNVYDVTFDVGGTGCTATNLAGLGFESSADLFTLDNNAIGTYLYVIVTNYSAPFVVEIFPAGPGAYIKHHSAHTSGFHNLFGIDKRLTH